MAKTLSDRSGGTPRRRSKPHARILKLLRELLPGSTIREEQSIRVGSGRDSRVLYVDLIVDQFDLAIECDGRQHGQFVQHFHGDKAGFEAAQRRDAAKAEALYDAGYTLLRLGEEECLTLTADELMARITAAIRDDA